MNEHTSELIFRFLPHLNEYQKEQIILLDELYRFWNDRVNVISRKDIDQLYLHHVLHSVSVMHFTDFNSGSKVLDIGTGGGFPGIPLAICYPEIEFHMIDGTGKKIMVVNEICNALGLKNAKGIHIRSEEWKGYYDIVTGRAVTNAIEFYNLSVHFLKKSGNLFYWSGYDPLILSNRKIINIYKLDDLFAEEYFIGKCIYHFKS